MEIENTQVYTILLVSLPRVWAIRPRNGNDIPRGHETWDFSCVFPPSHFLVFFRAREISGSRDYLSILMATPTSVVPADVSDWLTPTSVGPADVSDWLATSVPFGTLKRGKNAFFSESNSVVELRGSERRPERCVVYTRDPLPVRQLWQTTVYATRGWIAKLVSGCVFKLSVLPEGMHCQ